MFSLCASAALKESNVFKASSKSVPHIRCEGNIFSCLSPLDIFVDDTHITKGSDLISAVTTLFGLFWLFDITYTKEHSSLWTLLDNVVFKKKSVPASINPRYTPLVLKNLVAHTRVQTDIIHCGVTSLVHKKVLPTLKQAISYLTCSIESCCPHSCANRHYTLWSNFTCP
jgi:hypothetical protein